MAILNFKTDLNTSIDAFYTLNIYCKMVLIGFAIIARKG
jgi:hypothetical protein